MMRQRGGRRTTTGAKAKEVVSFAGVGGFSTPVLGSSAGYVAGAALNYCLNYHLTFQSAAKHRTAIFKFIAVAIIGLSLNALVMAFLLKRFAIHYLAAQAGATGIVFCWNFLMSRFWTFVGSVESL
jgi:putative flippase GtrA